MRLNCADRYFALAEGDIFFEPDSRTEPVKRGALFRRLKAKGVIIVVLNHDAILIIVPDAIRTRWFPCRRPSPTTSNMPTNMPTG
jgi:hypothetical protein